MNPHALLASALLAAGVFATTANASPYAGQSYYLDSGVVTVHGTDRAIWHLTVSAAAGGTLESRSSARLYLVAERCVAGQCRQVGRWSRVAQPGEVTINSDLSHGQMRAVLGGVAFDVSLKSSEKVTAVTVYSVGAGAADGPHPAAGRYVRASGSLTLGKQHCLAAQGEIGELDQVDAYGDDARWPTAPPAHLPKALAGARC